MIDRIEAAGAELDSDPRGWGFFTHQTRRLRSLDRGSVQQRIYR